MRTGDILRRADFFDFVRLFDASKPGNQVVERAVRQNRHRFKCIADARILRKVHARCFHRHARDVHFGKQLKQLGAVGRLEHNRTAHRFFLGRLDITAVGDKDRLFGAHEQIAVA